MIPYGRQDITDADIRSVVEVLGSDFLTQGPMVPRFEAAICDRVHAQYALAMNSATSALHVACLALGVGPGDVVWTTPNTFVASANCARYCGADVDFVDIDPCSWNLSVSRLREKLVAARAANRPLPKVVIPVHFAGQPTDQDEIWSLAQEFGFRVIEDASHSIGAERDGEPVGSCRWSDITIFSFHPVKIITTAEGGVATTNNAELAQRMSMLRSHGITREASKFTHSESALAPSWYYEQQMLGFNYRMTDLQAALGLSQLSRLSEYIATRNQLVARYDEALSGLKLQRPTVSARNLSAFHLYVVRIKAQQGRSHRDVYDALRAAGVGVNLHYYPVHLQPYYRDLGFAPGHCPEAETYAEEAVTLPLFPRLSSADQSAVIAAVREVVGHAD